MFIGIYAQMVKHILAYQQILEDGGRLMVATIKTILSFTQLLFSLVGRIFSIKYYFAVLIKSPQGIKRKNLQTITNTTVCH